MEASTVWRATAKKRMVAKLPAIKAELTRRRREPTATAGEWLQKVTRGYYRCHAVPGNLGSVGDLPVWALLWRMVLIHRSQPGDVG
jgi:RNA-directed DNA polymerase